VCKPGKPLYWVGSSKKDLMGLPEPVRRFFGHALHFAQLGEQHESAKPLKGFGGAGVLEIVKDDVAGTYRAVYTVRIRKMVFVLHCFQKKSKSGISTPKRDIELIRSRITAAEAMALEMRYGKAKV
jgi:phage-related protein